MERVRSAMKNVLRYLQLPPVEREILFHALWMLPLTACALRLWGFERCQAILIRQASLRTVKSAGPIERDLGQARAAARMVEIAARRGLCRARCLQQSLVLWWLMQRQGICVDVCFGIRKDETGLTAHAWVELAGVVLNDREDVQERFAAFRSAISSAGLQMSYVQETAPR